MSASTIIRPNIFEEVIIGTQTWMKRNYDFGGTPYDSLLSNISSYGKLYTWTEAMAINLSGWHLPTQTEWNTLITYLGGSLVAGGYLKSTGTTYWDTPNSDADNSSGFSALPGGGCQIGGTGFYGKQTTALFWSTTENPGDTTSAYYFYCSYNSPSIGTNSINKTINRFSVRLIKD